MKSAEDFLADATEGLKVLFNDEVLLNFDVCVKAMEDYSKLLAVEEVDKWISVEDRLPEKDGEYDVSFPEPTGEMAVIVMSFDFEDKQWYKNNPQSWQRPTHWRNRPSAPKQDKQK